MFVDKVEHTGSISIEQALKELEEETEKEK